MLTWFFMCTRHSNASYVGVQARYVADVSHQSKRATTRCDIRVGSLSLLREKKKIFFFFFPMYRRRIFLLNACFMVELEWKIESRKNEDKKIWKNRLNLRYFYKVLAGFFVIIIEHTKIFEINWCWFVLIYNSDWRHICQLAKWNEILKCDTFKISKLKSTSYIADKSKTLEGVLNFFFYKHEEKIVIINGLFA